MVDYQLMKNLIVKYQILIIFSIIFIGCGNPKIDTSTLGKYKASLEEVRNSLPLDKLDNFDNAMLIYSYIPSEINGKTGLEIIEYHQIKLKEIELKAQERAKKEAEETAKKAEELVFRPDEIILNIYITDSRGNPKILKLGTSIIIETNEKEILKQLYGNKKVLIIDKITKLAEGRLYEELLTVGGKDLLKDEMKEAIEYILKDNKEQIIIRTRILFTTFVRN